MAKHTPKHNKPKPKPMRSGYHPRRNADAIPDDILLTPAPILAPSMAMLRSSRPSRSSRAAAAVRKKFAPIGRALKPEAATITKDHLIGVAANASGAIGSALIANELADDLGPVPLAWMLTAAGGAGSAFLTGNWQRIAQGMLGAGAGQLGTAYLTERALKKAAAAQKAAATAPPAANQNAPAGGKRNAYLPVDEEDLVRAMERTERRLGALLDDDARNGAGDLIDAELVDDSYAWAA